MKKYYSDDNVILYKGDTFKVLKKLPKSSVQMIFADPPYFLSNNGVSCHSGKQVSVNKGAWDKGLSVEEKIKYNRKWIKLCKDVLTDDGTIWVSGTYHNIYTIGVALELEGFSIINNITWQKPNPTPNLACRSFTHSTETIIWARKILSNGKKSNHYFNYEIMKEINNGKQMKDVWLMNLPRKNEKIHGKHPTQKPVSLLERIILASTEENDIILDPFSGSATTGVAALKHNRKYIGIELDENYSEIAVKRLNDTIIIE